MLGPILAGKVADATGSYGMAYVISASLMIFAAILTFFTKAPEKELVEELLPIRALKAEAD